MKAFKIIVTPKESVKVKDYIKALKDDKEIFVYKLNRRRLLVVAEGECSMTRATTYAISKFNDLEIDILRDNDYGKHKN